jgi:iron-sulfur cluster assembly protein
LQIIWNNINISYYKVSDTASKKIVAMMNDDGFDATQDYVRVGVKKRRMFRLSYELKFDKIWNENDKVLKTIM